MAMDVSEDSSSTARTYNYDVFLSFNGSGRRTIAEQLYDRLEDAGIRVFKGEELSGGQDISSSLRRAIKCSRISIPIISDDYAENTQCLDEVVQMLECRESQGQRIFPVYHLVDPHDIRNQMSSFRYSFTEHERGGIDLNRIEIWKKALCQLASLKGWEVLLWLHERDIERITSHVFQSLKESSSSINTDVFDGSSNLVDRIPDYDVFLNFGFDTRSDFANLLYHRLKDAGVLVFRGEDIVVGEEMVDFTQQVIKCSRISIPIFSRGYVWDKWCLDVVEGMVECRKGQHNVFPIYYQIDPDDMKNQMGDLGYFYERVDPDRMGIWKRALGNVASLKGWKFDQWSGNDLIEHIVSHVLQSLKEDISSVAMDVPVGSSLVKRTYDYDVFLNFGSDIERDFANRFYHRLKDARIIVYRDEDVPVGEEVAGFALQAMKRSKISIPIFSEGYAKSKQRLDEVVEMLECRKSKGHRVFPIYYQIDPEDIRNQMGEFGYIFTIHDKEVDRGRNEIWKWKLALHEVASLKGWELDKQFQDGDIERIKSHVLRSLKGKDSLSITMDVSEGSSNLVDKIPDYNVYLNFGPDTRRGFADLLYHRLKDAGVLVFRDEDIVVGEEMIDFAQQVIKRSRIYIPIFSCDYTMSQQRLDEVVQMLECKKNQGHCVFPIYYDIDPSNLIYEVRQIPLQHWSFGMHRRSKVDPDKIEMWEKALAEVASLERWELDDKSMDDTVESVISKVLRVLNGEELLELDGGNAGTSATPFEVVLSFNVSDGIACSFYEHMKDAGICVFGFDKLPVEEEEIDKEFVQVIKNCEICIPFFTKDYLASTLCLRQLTHIMEAWRNSPGQLVIPVFYDVEPPDVNLEMNSYTNALKEHEQNFPTEVVRRWKEALREAAELQGWRFKAEGFERYNESIVIAVLKNKLKEKHRGILVGMQDQVERLKKVLDMESQGVKFVGIHGIGGIGKTTLARAIFDQLSTHFEGCSFLRDVREILECKGLKHLQDQLLRDITCVDSDCETKAARHISLGKKVLIVLDDVDERGQVKKLVGKYNRFASGSRIIVTTRDINVLAVEHETIDGRILEWPKEVLPFKMVEMKSAEALQIFCCHAFGKVSPPNDYLHICEKVVETIGKLPLALEIIGSYLHHKPESVWKATLDKLKNLPDHELHTKLMISYEALDLKTKEVFLDIACFFSGQEKTKPIYMWDACELLPELAIEALSFLSFVKIQGDNRLWMHDEIKDFGRKIICGGFTEDSAKCSRLWANDKVLDILRSEEVNENVQGLRLCFDQFLQDCTFPHEVLGSLSNLRFLELPGFPFAVMRVLPKLKWLSWHFYPQHLKASDLHLENLVILDLSNSDVGDQLGESGQLEMAKHLKVLDLTNCKRITRTPIFPNSMILERVILDGCENLVKIDSSIGNLKRLMHLNLKGCYSLRELPNELGSATALTKLMVKGNGQPFKLQESLIGLTSLSVLEIHNVKIIDPVVHIGNSKRLEFLILSDCFGIMKLMEPGRFFSLLVKLDVSRSEISQLPDSIGEMKNLKVINMESSLISELPKSIGHLEKLEELHAKNCSGLHGEIPSEIGTLSSLKILDLSYTRISSLPSTLTQLSNLQTLNLECCEELEELPELPKSLITLQVMCKKLHSLADLSEMNSLRDLQLFCALDHYLGKLSRLEKLELCITRINILKFGDTSQLRSLSLSCTGIETITQLPSTLLRLRLANFKEGTILPSLCNLKSLTSIGFYNCSFGDYEFRYLEAVKLNSLEHFSASNCYISTNGGLPLPERLRELSLRECELPGLLDLQTLKYLMCLELIDCQLLTEIRGLEKLESLEEIIICNCSSLEIFGDLSDVKNLEALQIDNCKMLREVKGLDRMTSLKHLQICHCELLETLPSRLKLKKRRRELLADLH